MALVADLVTRLTVDDKQFNSKMARATNLASKFSRTLVKGIGIAGAAFTVFASGAGLLMFNSLSKNAKVVGELTDNLQKIGVGVKQFQALDYAASKAGLSTGTLQSLLSKMQVTLGAAQLGGKRQNEALSTLGLSLSSLQGLSADKQFLKIADALKQVSDRTIQAQLAQILLGKSGKEALGLINSNIDEALEKYKALGLGLSNAQGAALDSFDESRQLIGTIFTDLSQKISATVAPEFERFINLISDAVEEMGGLDKVAQSFGDSIVTGLRAGANALNEVYRTMLAIQILDNERQLRVVKLSNPDGGNQQLSADQIRQITYNPKSGKAYDPRALQYSYLPSIASAMKTIPIQNEVNSLYNKYNGATKVGQQLTDPGSMTSVVPAQIIDVGKASDKASKSIQMLGDSAEKTKNMFQSAFDNETGTSDQISRILNGADLPQTVIDEDFDRLASSILSEFRRGGNANGASIQTNLSVLGKWAEQNSINGDNTAQLNAFKELQKYINKESDKQKVEITFIPSKYGYIEWANSPEGRKYAKEGAQQMAADEARGVRN